jgi:hypothetical protein
MNAAHFTLWNILVSSIPDAHAGLLDVVQHFDKKLNSKQKTN